MEAVATAAVSAVATSVAPMLAHFMVSASTTASTTAVSVTSGALDSSSDPGSATATTAVRRVGPGRQLGGSGFAAPERRCYPRSVGHGPGVDPWVKGAPPDAGCASPIAGA